MKKAKFFVFTMSLIAVFSAGAFAANYTAQAVETAVPTTVPTPVSTPSASEMGIAFPNPAKINGSITVTYPGKDGLTIREAKVSILSMNGRKIATVLENKDRNGRVKFGLSKFAPGIYFYYITVTYSDGSKYTSKIKKIAIVK
jgi:hypothetical protein